MERLRLERLATDVVTGLPLQPDPGVGFERVARVGVVYLQLGRFAGVESLYGWELYDRVLRLTAASLREDLDTSAFKAPASLPLVQRLRRLLPPLRPLVAPGRSGRRPFSSRRRGASGRASFAVSARPSGASPST